MLGNRGHASLLGMLMANLQSLEFVLRAYLYAHASASHVPFDAGKTLDSLHVGELVGVNAMTDYDTLGQLIDRYNTSVQVTHPHLMVDRSVVKVRDALAHGRVSTTDLSKPFKLLKFEKPKRSGTHIKVVFCESLTESWFDRQTKLVHDEIQKVAQAPNGSGRDIIPNH